MVVCLSLKWGSCVGRVLCGCLIAMVWVPSRFCGFGLDFPF